MEEIKKKYVPPRPNYYQGILQLRNVTPEIIEFVHNQMNKMGDVAITKTVRQEKGLDYYITSQRFIRIIGKKLKESFGGELTVTAKLHTRRQGKDLYRVTALFRLSKYRVGSIVNIRGDDAKILRIGRRVFVKDMKTGRKFIIEGKQLPE